MTDPKPYLLIPFTLFVIFFGHFHKRTGSLVFSDILGFCSCCSEKAELTDVKVFVSVSWIVSNLLFKVIVHGRSEVSHSSEEEELLYLDPTLRGLTATRYHIASWAPELVTSRHVQQENFMGKRLWIILSNFSIYFLFFLRICVVFEIITEIDSLFC